MSAPDPMRGVRGVFAATLALEAIVVLLALLVLAKFAPPSSAGTAGTGATPLGVGVIVALAVAMIVAAGLQRRPWGLGLALALQVVMIACGLIVPALAITGVVFALVWGGLLLLRRDVAGRMARGELPGRQQ
ncbi:MAG: DUF4233 domain-containing protein [Pseudonocardia sp.]